MELTERVLRDHAGERIFDRGVDYVRYVHGLRAGPTSARGSIQARRVYLVELDWSGTDLVGVCTCPHAADGHFCKHLVAIGLAALDELTDPPDESLDEQLARLDAPVLRELLADLANRDPGVARLVAVRASAGRPDDRVSTALLAAVDEALDPPGFIDYRRSFDVGRDAEILLDELERHLDSGAADAARPALLRTVTELRTISEHADDSSGVLGSACQKAAELHARSCREGSPDGAALARWLVDFRDSSPGWPETPLSDYAAAFDDEAFAEYTDGVAALDRRYTEAERWKRWHVDQMLLELADHRGDVDAAITILTSGEHRRYGAVLHRLRGAGRHDEVIGWMDRAVAEDRVSSRLGAQGVEHWLDPKDVSTTFLAAGREQDALEVLRTQFGQTPSFPTFDALVTFAGPLGHRERERTWALAASRTMATSYARGAVLVEIALGEDDLAAAWAAAEEFGAGHHWRELAAASADTMPREAAELHRPAIEEALRQPNSKRYPWIADELSRMRELYAKAGADPDFAEYLRGVRERFRRRPALMAALDRKGLR